MGPTRLGNELCGLVWGDMNVPAAVVSEIGRFVQILGAKKAIRSTEPTVSIASHLGSPKSMFSRITFIQLITAS